MMFEKMKCLMYMDCWSSIFKLIKKKFHFTQKYHYKNIKQKPTQIRKIDGVRSKIDSRLS